MKTKTSDSIELKRRGAKTKHGQTKAMKQAEELAFSQQRTKTLRDLQQAIKEKPAVTDRPETTP